MHVLVFSIQDFDRPYLEDHLTTHTVKYTSESLSIDTVHLAEGYDAVCLFSGDIADTEVISKLSDIGVKYITTRSVGYDHIDLAAAQKYGLAVANVPAYSPYSVSEFAVTLLLTLVRNMTQAKAKFDQQDFRLDGLVGFDLYGKKVGLIGCGRIGSNIAKIMQGFGCQISVYDPALDDENQFNLRITNLSEVLRHSDILFLSCPLNQETHHMLGKEELNLTKQGVIIINTARGAVIDTLALIEKMKDSHIGGLGLDVYEYEKGMYFHDFRKRIIEDKLFLQLRRMDNVLMTPHMGFMTKEALIGRAETTKLNLTQWEKKGVCENELTT